MQIKFNSNSYNNQGFGMSLHADTYAKNALRVRVVDDLGWKKINDLITLQEKNPVAHITLLSSADTAKLTGIISSNGKEEKYTESVFYDFENPVKFIKALCDKANEIALEHSDEINPVKVLDRLG